MVYRIIYFFLVSVIGTEVILLKKRRIKWSEGEKIYLIDLLKKNTESLNLANNILGGKANVNTYLANETWSSMADDINDKFKNGRTVKSLKEKQKEFRKIYADNCKSVSGAAAEEKPPLYEHVKSLFCTSSAAAIIESTDVVLTIKEKRKHRDSSNKIRLIEVEKQAKEDREMLKKQVINIEKVVQNLEKIVNNKN